MNEGETPSTAADIMALAEQAEAEAAEAEALAAAARARARAIQLRREAELAEARTQQAAREETAADLSGDEAAVDATADVGTEAPDTETTAAAESAVEPESESGEESRDEAAEAEKPGRRRLRRPKWSTVAAALAVIVVLAALSGTGYMVKEHRDAVRQRQRAAEFAAAARQGVVTLTSMDFNNAKQSVQRILDDSTGSFKDDFLKMADDFVKVVEQSKVVSQGTVQSAAVELDSMTDNSATVLVASTSEVTNAAGAKQDPRSYQLIVTVARDGDQIKISKVEFVP